MSWRPACHLRGGKLPRPDQRERDAEIVRLYRETNMSQDDIAAAFLVSRVTVWSAIKRADARISMSEVAYKRERRRRCSRILSA